MPTLFSPVEPLITDKDLSGRSPSLSASSPSRPFVSHYCIQYLTATRVRPPTHVQRLNFGEYRDLDRDLTVWQLYGPASATGI